MATTIDAGVRRLARSAATARETLRAVAAERARQLEALGDWRGRHATVHRRRTGHLLDRVRLVEWSANDLAGRLALVVAVTDGVSRLPRRARERFATVVADAAHLRVAAGDVAGHVDRLRADAAAVRWSAVPPAEAEARALARALRSLADDWAALDDWLLEVAGAMAAADDPGALLRLDLLGLGVDGPGRLLAVEPAAARGHGWGHVSWVGVEDAVLLDVLAWPTLPVRARDVLVRQLLARWAARLDAAAGRVRHRATGDRTPLDRLADAVDDHLLDLIDPVVRLHVSDEEHAEHLELLASGLRRLLAADDVTLLAVGRDGVGHPTVPAGGTATASTVGPAWPPGEHADPSVRLALGDVATATHVAVLVPGTGSGVARHESALADARALHGSLVAAAPPDVRPVVVVELYDAPADLAAAASGVHARLAARNLVTGLTALDLGEDVSVTLVGHSYGAVVAGLSARTDTEAVTAGRATSRRIHGLVALGAPGLGVAAIDELGLASGAVWAARAPGDPIALVGDVPGLARTVGVSTGSPLVAPTAGHGPDPAGPAFGALPLPTAGAPGTTPRGHLAYLDEGTSTLAATAAVVLGLGDDAGSAPARLPGRTGEDQQES